MATFAEPRRTPIARTAHRAAVSCCADIDALPVTERTGEEFASVNEGCMHACGHDCHIAMMLGTLQVLRHMTDDIHGEIRIVFQPSEENGSGGAKLCEARRM